MSTDLYRIAGVTFGRDMPVRVVSVDRGDRAVTAQDAPRAAGLGLIPGRDREAGPEWTFSLRTRGVAESALSAVGELRSAWAHGLKLRPGQSMPMVCEVDGRRLRVVGRPRRFHEESSPATRGVGLANVTCTFQLSDPRIFSDAEQSVSLALVPESTGGIIFPLLFPMTTTMTGGTRAGFVTNTGSAPAPVTVTFHGPVTNPRVFTDAWEVGIRGALAYDESITVDSLGLTVTRQDGASVAGRLTRRTRLRSAALAPGQQEVKFTGADPTGTAQAVVSWRDAHWSI